MRRSGILQNGTGGLPPSRSSGLEQFPYQRPGQHAALVIVDGGHLSGGTGELRFRQRDAQAVVRDLHPGGGGALAMAQAGQQGVRPLFGRAEQVDGASFSPLSVYEPLSSVPMPIKSV